MSVKATVCSDFLTCKTVEIRQSCIRAEIGAFGFCSVGENPQSVTAGFEKVTESFLIWLFHAAFLILDVFCSFALKRLKLPLRV